MDDLVLIDTNAWITYFDSASRGMPGVANEVEQLIDDERACYTEIIYMELIAGLKNEDDVKRFDRAFLSVKMKSLAEGPIWSLAGQNAHKLRKAGVKYKLVDLIIASVALCHDLQLFHHDNHFISMKKPLKLREYNLLNTIGEE